MNSLPLHIGIIMDGNGRWAIRRGLPRSLGHMAGVRSFRSIVNYCGKIGLKYLTLYAFSMENWSRHKDEVDQIIDLFRNEIQKGILNLKNYNFKINFLSSFKNLSEEFVESMKRIENVSKNNKGMVLNIALSYSSRNEIVDATKRIVDDVINLKLNLKNVDEKLFSSYLFTANQPDIDLVIRTGGEFRISNFLLWQSAYSEFWSTSIFWPDFKPKHLDMAISDFNHRERRFGNINNER